MRGSPPRRMARTRRLLVLSTIVVGGVLLASTAYGANENDGEDSRNDEFGLTYKGNPTQDCWKHHRPEGMRDSHIVIPLFPTHIKQGEVTNLPLQVENAWKHDIAELRIQLTLNGTTAEDKENYLVPVGGSAAESKTPTTGDWKGTLGNPYLRSLAPTGHPSSWANHTIVADQGVVAIFGRVEFFPSDVSTPNLPNRIDARFFQPGRSTPFNWEESDEYSDTARMHNLSLPRGQGIDALNAISGEWRLQLEFKGGDSATVQYAMNITVLYASVGERTLNVFDQVRNPPDPPAKPVVIIAPRGVSDVINIPVFGVKPGTQVVEVRVQALLYYKHQAGGTPNEDSFVRYATRTVTVGDSFIAGDVEAATAGTVEIDFFLQAGEVTGFAAAFLLLPSLLLGGTYGRTSRKFLNDVLGGAKRRVMFHNLSSLGLTLVALVHILFFMLEVRYTVLMGVLWGGLGAVSLLVLGLSGYYQVPLIQRLGYNWWRAVHLAFGLLVVVFVAYHTIADGPDFFFIKEQLPDWLNQANLAQK